MKPSKNLPHQEHTRSIGQRGEQIAIDYLTRSHYQIVARNWQIWGGELDIVAQSNEEIIFIEVKFRQRKLGGSAKESLSHKKQKQFRRSSELFLLKHDIQSVAYQYDFIAIDQHREFYRLHHFKNIELK